VPGLGRRARWAATAGAFLVAVAVLPALIVSRQGTGPDPTVVLGPTSDTVPSAIGDPVATTSPGASRTTSAGSPAGAAGGSPTGSPPGTAPAAGTAGAGTAATVLSRPVQPRPERTPPRTQYQEFLSVCGPLGAGRATVGGTAPVPVVFLGAPPSGPGLVPPAGAAPGRSSCLTAADRSSYWAPALSVGGRAVDPASAEVYYKSPVRDYSSVQPFPAGLRFETEPLATVAGRGRTGVWACGDLSGTAFPATCPRGAKLEVRLQSPGCWDGVRLDSPGHRAHLAYPMNDRCPGTHPVAVPMIELKLIYTVPAGPLDARLSTGGGPAFAFGFVAGWDAATAGRLVSACVDRGLRCGADGTPT